MGLDTPTRTIDARPSHITMPPMPDAVAAPSFAVADAMQLEGTLRVMGRRLHAEQSGPVALVGLRRRGVPLAERLAVHLRELGLAAPVGELDLARYDDDLHVLHDEPRLREVPLPFQVEGAHLVVIDDVLYTGRTLLTAASHLLSRRARVVECAVLCARGRPEVPVTAGTVGMRLDVPARLAIEVHVPPFEEDLGVWIRRVDG